MSQQANFFIFLFPPKSPKNPCRDPSNIEYSESALIGIHLDYFFFTDTDTDKENFISYNTSEIRLRQLEFPFLITCIR